MLFRISLSVFNVSSGRSFSGLLFCTDCFCWCISQLCHLWCHCWDWDNSKSSCDHSSINRKYTGRRTSQCDQDCYCLKVGMQLDGLVVETLFDIYGYSSTRELLKSPLWCVVLAVTGGTLVCFRMGWVFLFCFLKACGLRMDLTKMTKSLLFDPSPLMFHWRMVAAIISWKMHVGANHQLALLLGRKDPDLTLIFSSRPWLFNEYLDLWGQGLDEDECRGSLYCSFDDWWACGCVCGCDALTTSLWTVKLTLCLSVEPVEHPGKCHGWGSGDCWFGYCVSLVSWVDSVGAFNRQSNSLISELSSLIWFWCDSFLVFSSWMISLWFPSSSCKVWLWVLGCMNLFTVVEFELAVEA